MNDKPETATAAAFASGRLYGLQYLRAIGVLVVAAYHATVYVSEYSPLSLPEGVFDVGLRHLHQFFVVSGLLMMMIHWNEGGGWRNWRVFHLKRHFRIFPLVFLVVTAGAVGLWLQAMAGMGDETLSFVQYLNSMLIYPMLEPTKPSVMWTLRNELMFYLLFSLMFINRRGMLAIIVIWAGASLFLGERTLVGDWVDTGQLHEVHENIFVETFFWPFNYLFVLGIVSYYVIIWLKDKITWNQQQITIGFLIVYALFCFVSFRSELMPAGSLQGHLAVAVVGVVLMFFSVGVKLHGSVHDVLVYLGDASYSIYLVHPLVLATLTPLLGPISPTPVTMFYALLIASVIAGIVIYEWFEKPVLRRMRPFAK